ncbi:7 transmembrane receptor (rhodopsin family) domain-containing protein [Ditylenchus destructor]|nr:7 transmembrane receptor (rhodopsin family) domain-containing protein [Ditylenchus destructor]
MLGPSGNTSLVEVSLLCAPALLSLIRPPPQSSSSRETSSSLPPLQFHDVVQVLRRPECAPTLSDYFENNKGSRVQSAPISAYLNDSKNEFAVGQPRVYGGAGTYPYPATVDVPHGAVQEAENSYHFLQNGEDDEYWPAHIRIIMSLVFMALTIVGIVGNILVVVVVNKVPGMISPTNCYLVSLAISDCMFFVAAAPTEMAYLHIASSEYIFGPVGCAVFSYLPYLAINTSSMSITAFTVERFIGICYPLRARYICTVKRAKIIIMFIWIFGILYNSPWLYLATLKEDEHGLSCAFTLTRDSWAYKVMFLGDFAAFYIIPMILYVFIYGKITYTLSRCGLKYSETTVLQNPPSSDARTSDSFVGYPNSYAAGMPLKKHREYFINSSNRKSSTRGKVQVIKMLAVVVFIFAVCWLPYRAMVMWNSFASSSKWDPDWYIFLSKTMIFFNCAINPILYNLMSGRFRNAFKRLFHPKYTSNFGRNSLNSPTTIAVLRANRNKPNGNYTAVSIGQATSTVLTIAAAAGDIDPAKAVETFALVRHENGFAL